MQQFERNSVGCFQAVARPWRRALLLAVLLGWLPLLAPPVHGRSVVAGVRAQPAHALYLPLVQQADAFGTAPAIWPHAGEPAPHEVALFRHSFTLAGELSGATLEIFADTRYELWLDGRWLGRGPARFSRRTHEYDQHALGALGAGSHTLAVLVQWAPNLRRSESARPHLLVRLHGPGGPLPAAQSGPAWRALVSPAWQRDAAPIHAWRLIGPSELLDLRALPAGWAQPGFDDRAWPPAVAVDAPAARYQPRALPPLADVPMPVTVREVGVLAPGQQIAELLGPAGQPSQLLLRASGQASLTIETLATPELATTRALKLDGAPPAWQPRPGRADVLFATVALAPGRHTLAAQNAGPPGVTLSLAGSNLDLGAVPFGQGLHAGRRLLLAAPVSRPAAVIVGQGPPLSLSFVQTPAYAVIDLGRVVFGRVAATVRGPAGSVLDIGWDERLWQGARPLPFPGALHPEWNQTDSWVLDGGARPIGTIDARGGRYLLIAAWGPGTVELTNLQVFEERLPVPQLGSFTSADPLLNQIWQVGVDTLRPNMSDAYADPWREHGQWWGDAFVIDHANEAALGDSRILARGVALMAEAFEGGRPRALAPNGDSNLLLDYGLLWAQSLHDYQRRTGDTVLPTRLYPTLQQFIDYLAGFRNPATGLLDLPRGEWWETALIDWAATADRYGQSTALNALYYRTLLDAADVADAAADPARAAAWRQEAGQVRAAVNTYLYLPEQGAYLAALHQGAPRSPTPHAQAWALAYDIVPAAEQQRVASRLVAMLSTNPSAPNVEIYGMHWVLEGLGRAGRVSDAITIIKRYYGYMLDRGATTWWEQFNSHRSYTASLSHGWGAGPTWFLTTYALGARRSGPASWELRPSMRALRSMAGALPLEAGLLRVAWGNPACGRYTLELSAPAATSGSLIVPFPPDSTSVLLNGELVWRRSRALAAGVAAEQQGVRLELPGGAHRIEIQRRCAASA